MRGYAPYFSAGGSRGGGWLGSIHARVQRGTRAASTPAAHTSGCRAPTLTEPAGATYSRRRRSANRPIRRLALSVGSRSERLFCGLRTRLRSLTLAAEINASSNDGNGLAAASGSNVLNVLLTSSYGRALLGQRSPRSLAILTGDDGDWPHVSRAHSSRRCARPRTGRPRQPAPAWPRRAGSARAARRRTVRQPR